MRAIQFDDYGPAEVMRLAEIDTPRPGPGEVRIKVAAIGVNPADYKWRNGMFRDVMPLTLPHILGYDVAGTVDAVGDDVTAFQPGDRVLARMGRTTQGGYAEFAVAPVDAVASLPDGIDFARAASLPTAGLTGIQLVEDHIRPAPSEAVLITGATGQVGRFAMLAARACGARVVAGVRRAQADTARALGADAVIALDEQDAGDVAFDHVADTVGGASVTALCRRLAPGGRIHTVSNDPIDPAGLPSEPIFATIESNGERLARLIELVAAHDISPLIAHRLPLEQAVQAHRLMESGGVGGKIVLEP